MVLTFTCNNCHTLLTKSKIIRHYCLTPVINTTNEANNVVDNQGNGSVVPNKHFALVTMGLNNQEWNDFVATSLIKHETDDENLRLVLNGLRYRKNFPRKENKFYNYINAFLPSKNVPDCAKIIWDIVTNKLKEYPTDTSSVMKSETENISLQKRKLDTDNSTIESNTDVPEEKKTKLSDNIILPDAVPSEIEQTSPSNEIDVLEQNTVDISGNTDSSNPNNSEIDKLAANNSENPPNVPAAPIEKAVPSNEKSSNRNLVWKEKVIERLSNYETQDENMKSVINTLKYKKYLPQKEDKFIKLLKTIPKSRKIENCCRIIWGAISGQESQIMEPEEMMPQLPAVEISNPQLDSDLLTINGNLECLDFTKNVNVTMFSENNVETNSLTVESVCPNKELPKPVNVEQPVVPISHPTNLINNEMLGKRATKFKHLLTAEEWHVKVMEALNKYQTSDTNLLILIARLKTRNNIPQKFFKFKNFIHNMPLSHKIASCADLLWDIILPGNPDTSKNRSDGLSSGMPILTCVESMKQD